MSRLTADARLRMPSAGPSSLDRGLTRPWPKTLGGKTGFGRVVNLEIGIDVYSTLLQPNILDADR